MAGSSPATMPLVKSGASFEIGASQVAEPEVEPAELKLVVVPRSRRIDAFDSIRFILIAYIVCAHFVSFAKPSPFVHKALSQKNVVVAAFFALSGYVSAYTGCEVGQLKCKDRVTATPPATFTLSKVFGYWPLHLFVLLIFSPMFVWIDLKYEPLPKGLWTVLFNASLSVTMTQCWFPSKAEIWNAPTWFLGSLTFANMLTPYFLPVIAKQDKKQLRRTAIWITVFSLLPKLGYCFATDSFDNFEGAMKASVFFNEIRFSPFFCLLEVMIGAVACRLVMLDEVEDSENQGCSCQTTSTTLPLFGMTAVIFLRATDLVKLSDTIVKPLFFLPLFLLLLMGLHRASVAKHITDPLAKFMSLRPLTWLGGLSFPIYIVHQPLGQIFYKKVFYQATWKKWFDISFEPWFFCIYLLIVVGVAFLLNKFFMQSSKVAEWSKRGQAFLLKFV